MKKFFSNEDEPRPTDAVMAVNKMNLVVDGETGDVQIASAAASIDMAITKVNAGMATADSNIEAIQGVMEILAGKLSGEQMKKASLEAKLAELHVVKTKMEDM